MKTLSETIEFAQTQEFGICMEGNQASFARWLSLAPLNQGMPFTYLEVGVASGKTMAAACRILSFINPDREIRAVGYDIGGTDCFDPGAIKANLDAIHGLSWGLVQDSAVHGLGMSGQRNVDFALIDACHGAPCAKGDFVAVAARMRVGGIVAFHDASPRCQGHHHQPHCGTGIDVRAALMDLGLLPRSAKDKSIGLDAGTNPGNSSALPGWALCEDVDAVHGCVFVQKTA